MNTRLYTFNFAIIDFIPLEIAKLIDEPDILLRRSGKYFKRKKKWKRRNDDNNVYGYGDVAHGTTWLSSSWSGMRHKRDIMDESKSGLGFSFRGISPY